MRSAEKSSSRSNALSDRPSSRGWATGRSRLQEREPRRNGVDEQVAPRREFGHGSAVDDDEIVNARVARQVGTRFVASGEEHVGQGGQCAFEVEVALRVEDDSERLVDSEHCESLVVGGEIVVVIDVGAGAARGVPGERDHQHSPAPGGKVDALFENRPLVETDPGRHAECIAGVVADGEQKLEAIFGAGLAAEIEARDRHVAAPRADQVVLHRASGDVRRCVECAIGDEHDSPPLAVAQQARAESERGAWTSRFVGGPELRQGAVQDRLVALEGGEKARAASARNEDQARRSGQCVDPLLRLAPCRLETGATVPFRLHARAHVHYQNRVSRLRDAGDPARVREGEGAGGGEQQQGEQAEVAEQPLQAESTLPLAQRLAPQRGRGHHHPAAPGAQAVQHDEDGERGEREQPERMRQVHHRRRAPWRRYLSTKSSKGIAVLARRYSTPARRQ